MIPGEVLPGVSVTSRSVRPLVENTTVGGGGGFIVGVGDGPGHGPVWPHTASAGSAVVTMADPAARVPTASTAASSGTVLLRMIVPFSCSGCRPPSLRACVQAGVRRNAY